MRDFLKNSAYAIRNSNILFVCGGSDATDMRPLFHKYAKEHLSEYKIYFPEFSFENLFLLEGDGAKFIDLNKFEETVANLSCCVILFPEAPGSLVELGLFSGHQKIVESLLVVVDRKHDDGGDSFITLGPVNRINTQSRYRSVFVESYNDISFFDKIKNRLNDRHKVTSRHKKVEFIGKKWDDLSYFERLSAIHWFVEVCRISDINVLKFMAKSMFGTTVKGDEVVNIASILIGSNEFSLFGEEKWIRVSDDFTPIITVKSGEENVLADLRMALHDLYLKNDIFNELVQEAYS